MDSLLIYHLRLVNFAKKMVSCLDCLLEYGSHLMQPCDLKPFSSLKETWKQAVREYQIENVGENVTKSSFAKVFKQAWCKSSTTEITINSFLDSGLFPLDVSQVIKTIKTEPSKIFSSTSLSDLSTSNTTAHIGSPTSSNVEAESGREL